MSEPREMTAEREAELCKTLSEHDDDFPNYEFLVEVGLELLAALAWEKRERERLTLLQGEAFRINAEIIAERDALAARLDAAEARVAMLRAQVRHRDDCMGRRVKSGFQRFSCDCGADAALTADPAKAHDEKVRREERGAAVSGKYEPSELWETHWRHLVCDESGNPDLEKIKNELSDYAMLLDFVPKVYDHVTGGRISKPNTLPDVVCNVADDAYGEIEDDNIKEAVAYERERIAAIIRAEAETWTLTTETVDSIVGEILDVDCAALGARTP